jgi:hypothetical protein
MYINICTWYNFEEVVDIVQGHVFVYVYVYIRIYIYNIYNIFIYIRMYIQINIRKYVY